MYFIIIFLLSWIWFWFKADKNRMRELFGVAIYTSFLGLLTDLIMIHNKLWSYHGLPHPLYTIPLVLDFSIYPVVSYLFTQNLPPSWLGIIIRTLSWTLFSVIFEWITLKTGHMDYHQWWNLWLSAGADLLIYLSIAGIYRFYGPAYAKSPQFS